MSDQVRGGIGCQVTSGFFVLSRCPERALANCANCGRPICGRHSTAGPQGSLCPECAPGGRLEQDQARDQSWAARYRRRYRAAAEDRFGDRGINWSFRRYDQHYFNVDMSAGGGAADDGNWDDPSVFDS